MIQEILWALLEASVEIICASLLVYFLIYFLLDLSTNMTPKLRSILTGFGAAVTLAASFRVLPQHIADAIVSESPKILPAVLILWSAVAGKRHVDER